MRDTIFAMLIVFGTMGLFTYSIIQMAKKENARYERLMRQCIEDGKKEYECESMLRSKNSSDDDYLMGLATGIAIGG